MKFRFDFIIEFDKDISLEQFAKRIGYKDYHLYDRYKTINNFDRGSFGYSHYSLDYDDVYIEQALLSFLEEIEQKYDEIKPILDEYSGNISICVVLDEPSFDEISLYVNKKSIQILNKMNADLDFDTGLFN